MIITISNNNIVTNDSASNGKWCLLPYPNHPNGCPNYGKKKTCPPFTKPFKDLVQEPFYLVIEEFDILLHAEKMKNKHPDWSERQCRNLLYWQKRVVKNLKQKSYNFAKKLGDEFIVLEVPEANGVDVFKTCKNVGIELQTYPQDLIRKVMIVGKSK